MAEMMNEKEAGVARFDAVAQTWEADPGRAEMAQTIARAMLAAVELAGDERAMEFGSGTGLVTGMLAGHVGHILAVDNSPGMLKVFDENAREAGLDNVESRRVDLDLETPRGPFDFVFSSMTLHHIKDVQGLMPKIFAQLNPGGRIAFADLAEEDGSFHGEDRPGVHHHGFSAARLTSWLSAAGFEDIEVEVVYQLTRARDDGSSRDYPVQLVTARRPA